MMHISKPPFLYYSQAIHAKMKILFLSIDWKSMGSKTTLNPTDFHYIKKKYIYIFCVMQNKESHTGLEQHEGE